MNPGELEFLHKQGIEVLRELAQGGYGTIYLVYIEQYKQEFALKKVPKSVFNRNELECMKMIDNPRIVRLYSFYEFEQNIYFLMEYCPDNLNHYMQTNKMISQDDVRRFVFDVIYAVKACHDLHIAHSDIKPSNFLIDRYGRLKISDFGLSAVYTDNPTSNEFKGTRCFMAPEMFIDHEYNPVCADIWAVGVTLYFIATHCLPFFSKDKAILMRKVKHGQFMDGLIQDEELRRLVKSCLTVNPAERPTINELIAMPYVTNYFQNLHSLTSIKKKLGCSYKHLIIRPDTKRRISFESKLNICLVNSLNSMVY